MSSDDVLSSGLKSGGYSSNATTASMFWNNSADSLEYTIYSNTSVGNNATSDHTVDYVFSMPAWSQCIMYSLFLFLVRVAVRSTIPDARFQEVSQLRRLREERFATLRKDPDARRLAIENGLITKVRSKHVKSDYKIWHVQRKSLKCRCGRPNAFIPMHVTNCTVHHHVYISESRFMCRKLHFHFG